MDLVPRDSTASQSRFFQHRKAFAWAIQTAFWAAIHLGAIWGTIGAILAMIYWAVFGGSSSILTAAVFGAVGAVIGIAPVGMTGGLIVGWLMGWQSARQELRVRTICRICAEKRRLDVIWNERTVGYVQDVHPSICLIGKWIPAETPDTRHFLWALKSLGRQETLEVAIGRAEQWPGLLCSGYLGHNLIAVFPANR